MSAFNQVSLKTHNRVGTYKTPYILGSSANGSGTNSLSNSPWVYVAPNGDLSLPRNDTWHRERPPTNSDGIVTDGVKLDLQRIYIVEDMGSGIYTEYVFTRTAIFDSLGYLVSVSAETLEETNTSSGTGSAGGGI